MNQQDESCLRCELKIERVAKPVADGSNPARQSPVERTTAEYAVEELSFHEINGHVQERLVIHLRNKSRRRYRVPEGHTLYQHLQQLGLHHLRGQL